MNEIGYTMVNGYRIPNLLPHQEPEIHLGKYALLRRRFLMQHRPGTFSHLLTSGSLNPHLMQVDREARARMERLTAEIALSQGVTEELKAANQMRWVGLMNNIRSTAEEVVLNELIYV